MVCGVMDRPRRPWWLMPNLLSLDAPLVAAAWLYMFAQTWLKYHPVHMYVVLGLAVWVVYVADRLLDAWVSGGTERCRERHRFHRRHWRLFVVLALVASGVAVWLVLAESPMAIFGYLVAQLALVSGFFVLALFATPGSVEIPYAKNILGGLSFAFGTAMAAHVYLYDKRVIDLVFGSRELVAFAVLCILNISAIDLWEHSSRSADVEEKAQDELSLTLPLTLLGGASLFFALQAGEQGSRPFFYAILTGAGLLHVLNRVRGRFSMEALRVLADVALLLPLLVFVAFSGGS